jgi:hypothetical protein
MPTTIAGNDGGLIGSPSQAWTNVTSSRSSGVTYTNSTGKPIMVSVFISDLPNQASNLNITVNSAAVYPSNLNGPIGYGHQYCFVVQTGYTYSISWNASANFAGWWELR